MSAIPSTVIEQFATTGRTPKFKLTRKRITLTKSHIAQFTSLVSKLMEFLEKDGSYSEKTIAHFKTGLRVVFTVMLNNDIKKFNCQTAKKIRKIIQSTNPNDRTSYLSALNHLDEFQSTGTVRPNKWWRKTRPTYEFPGKIGSLISDFLSHCCREKKSVCRIRFLEMHLHRFNEFCIENKIVDYKISAIMKFLTEFKFELKTHPRYAITAVTALTKHLYLSEKIPNDFTKRIPKFKNVEPARQPSVYSEEEIRKILSVIDQSSPIGKRNFAIVLMVLLLGVRGCDVANLQMNNIDWANERILFTQVKTGKPASYPLLPALSNAIMQYLEYGRRESAEPFIFLLERPPFNQLTASAIGHVFERTIRRANINPNGRTTGSRAFRSTLATDVTNAGVGIHTTMDILGHSSIDMVKYYADIDFEKVRLCAGDVPPISDRFYFQNGFIL